MKLPRRILKTTALITSVLLIGLYVYDRAGGNLLEKIYPDASAQNERPMMSSSKVKALLPALRDSAQKRELMPGPKSAPVFSEPAPAAATPPQSDETHERKTLMHGSKSMSPVIPPPQDSTAATPLPQQSSPNPRSMIFGSKSATPLIRAPNDPVNSAPNSPPQTNNQQRRTPAKQQINQGQQAR
jgi:hypothetical protein